MTHALRLRRSSARWLLAGSMLAAAACQDAQNPTAGDPRLSNGAGGLTLTASHESVRMVIGDTLRLSVMATNPAGRTIPHDNPVSWASADALVAAVDSSGLVTAGSAPGETVVTVTHANERWADTVRITVTYPEEARALWVNRFEWGATPNGATGTAKIIEIMDRAKSANFNIVYFQIRGEGDAYYPSELEPCTFRLCGTLGNGQPSWDPLAVAVREAHARGIELHAWFNALTGWSSPTGTTNASYCARLVASKPGSPNHMLIDHPEWQLVGSDGKRFVCTNSQAYEYTYVSPGIPAVRTHVARVAADIVRRYQVDGIHLDRIRYPSNFLSYDAESVAAFGRRAGASDPAWIRWRQEAVNQTVKEIHDSIDAVRPKAVLSGAVWGIYEDNWNWRSSRGLMQYFQDPRAWARDGYFDVAVPMTYYNTHATYCGFADWACLLDDHIRGYEGTGRHLYISISPNTPASKTNVMVLDQIAMGRARGVKGFSFYAWTAMNQRNLWPVLAAGPFKEPASVPYQDWQ